MTIMYPAVPPVWCLSWPTAPPARRQSPVASRQSRAAVRTGQQDRPPRQPNASHRPRPTASPHQRYVDNPPSLLTPEADLTTASASIEAVVVPTRPPPPQTDSTHRSEESRRPMSSATAPTIRLPVEPGLRAGPFILGSSVYGTLAFLRQSTFSSSLFPDVQITYDKNLPHRSPISIQPAEGLELIFAPLTANAGRLQCIVIRLSQPESRQQDESLQGQTSRRVAATSQSRSEKSTSERGQSGMAGSPSRLQGSPAPTASSESASRRRLLLTCQGRSLDNLTRGHIQQLFGPTYPARRYLQGDGLHILVSAQKSASGATEPKSGRANTEGDGLFQGQERWVLSYEGISFLFSTAEEAAIDLSKAARPTHLVLHSGGDPVRLPDLAWPVRMPSTAGFNGSATLPKQEDTDYSYLALSNTVQLKNSFPGRAPASPICHRARIRPGRGLDLYLIAPPFPPPDAEVPPSDHSVPDNFEPTSKPDISERPLIAPIHRVSIELLISTPQDVLLELGPPERKWVKGQKTVAQQSSDALATFEDEADLFSDWPRTAEGNAHSSRQGDASLSEFWSYPSLGVDFLFRFRVDADQMGVAAVVLAKIIVHSDVPGSAVWGRYEYVPWFIEHTSTPPTKLESNSANSGTSIENRELKGRSPSARTGSKGPAGSASSRGTSRTSSPSMSGKPPGCEVIRATIDTDLKVLEATLGLQPAQAVDSEEVHATSAARETMHLDRSAEDEFRSMLRLDVRTELRGYPGVVAEVFVPGADQGANQGQDKTGLKRTSSEGTVVAWTIVPAAITVP
ncbi:unnamed protein product [Parajaminaea phylloscopi]